jgi:sulfopyruvate decarboxylase beta subunit
MVADTCAAAGIEFVVSLPCDRTKILCEVLGRRFRYVTIAREEDGIGICSGLSLAGRGCLLAIQSSGLGNSLNALMTLPHLYRLPLPILASWRGVYRETIPAQVPFNEKIPELLSLYGIPCTKIWSPAELSSLRTVIADAYSNQRPHVALIQPGVWEGDDTPPAPGPCPPVRERPGAPLHSPAFPRPVMTRAGAIRSVAPLFTDEIVVGNIGVPSKELHAARDRPENFYMLGSYTQATPLGLGIALGSERQIVVLDGDGSILGTAVLPTVAAERPQNLMVICLDNGVFGSTGNQCSPAYATADLELLARAAGITATARVHTPEELKAAFRLFHGRGPSFIHCIIEPGNAAVPDIPLDPVQIRERVAGCLRQN